LAIASVRCGVWRGCLRGRRGTTGPGAAGGEGAKCSEAVSARNSLAIEESARDGACKRCGYSNATSRARAERDGRAAPLACSGAERRPAPVGVATHACRCMRVASPPHAAQHDGDDGAGDAQELIAEWRRSAFTTIPYPRLERRPHSACPQGGGLRPRDAGINVPHCHQMQQVRELQSTTYRKNDNMTVLVCDLWSTDAAKERGCGAGTGIHDDPSAPPL
jgi:hypothetical protein